ncbi:hypothetical protein AB8U03_16145 [Clostridium sp. Mt-5]|uniref:Uncharacterized protein n=1 Tax=Clostridium moutaii TaxID=3240932 RepID=A0ABV4BU13_9CLOT
MIQNKGNILNKMKLEILKSINSLVNSKIKKINYCHILYGQIQQYNRDNSYNTLINGQVQVIHAMNDDKYQIGDTVIVLVLDNTNYSNKMILCKRPANII